MTSVSPQSTPSAPVLRRQRGNSARAVHQRGVVLIIALVMLVVVSLLTTLSIRSATSTEKISGNVRTTELAKQAAEIALRYCEDAVVQVNAGVITLPGTPTILAYQAPPRWKDIANWDVPASDAFLVPKDFVNQATGAETFKREPECMVERIPVVASTGLLSNTSTYVITARGFGPEVATATAARDRPQGSEVWMQSTIELN